MSIGSFVASNSRHHPPIHVIRRLHFSNIFVIICSVTYVISYYDAPLQEAILVLPDGLRGRYIALTDRMENYGANLGEPHTKAFGGGLFELRLKSAEGIARVFYCTLIEQRIVMLHSFIKKSQKTPMRELRIAEMRMKEIKHADTR